MLSESRFDFTLMEPRRAFRNFLCHPVVPSYRNFTQSHPDGSLWNEMSTQVQKPYSYRMGESVRRNTSIYGLLSHTRQKAISQFLAITHWCGESIKSNFHREPFNRSLCAPLRHVLFSISCAFFCR